MKKVGLGASALADGQEEMQLSQDLSLGNSAAGGPYANASTHLWAV
jgi:hypothetical protein